VLLGLQHAEVWPWVLVGAGVGLLRYCTASAIHTFFFSLSP
jgi:hypothetical protein